jgi:hypothetical protein
MSLCIVLLRRGVIRVARARARLSARVAQITLRGLTLRGAQQDCEKRAARRPRSCAQGKKQDGGRRCGGNTHASGSARCAPRRWLCSARCGVRRALISDNLRHNAELRETAGQRNRQSLPSPLGKVCPACAIGSGETHHQGRKASAMLHGLLSAIDAMQWPGL